MISLKIVPNVLIDNIPALFFFFYSSVGSDNGLAPFRHQAIIWTNDG